VLRHKRTTHDSGKPGHFSAIRPILRPFTALHYNIHMPIPPGIEGQKYIRLTTFRKNGEAVHTPVWFGEDGDELTVMTRNDSGKYKRLRNNPQVRVSPCTIRGRVTGPEFAATARILPAEDWPRARRAIREKYWLARISFLWSKQNVYLRIGNFTTSR
jgi:PPOX class probable F420-dependent enzyme